MKLVFDCLTLFKIYVAFFLTTLSHCACFGVGNMQ